MTVAMFTEDQGFTTTTYMLRAKNFRFAMEIGRWYGPEARDTLSQKLDAQTGMAINWMRSLEQGQENGKLRMNWIAKTDDVAGYLASLNDKWDAQELHTLLGGLRDREEAVARARVAGTYFIDAMRQDDLGVYARGVAARLAAGIIADFPAVFGGPVIIPIDTTGVISRMPN